jgi:uncharacterized membrane protein
MRRIVILLIAITLTFIIGVSARTLWNAYRYVAIVAPASDLTTLVAPSKVSSEQNRNTDDIDRPPPPPKR